MPKNGMLALAGVADRLDLALDAALPKPPGTRMPSTPAEQPLGALALDLLGLDPARRGPGPCGDAGVVERLVDRLVGVVVLDVLADDGDRHLVLGVA